MVLLRHAKWIYAAAGSGIGLGVFSYLQSDKKCVQMFSSPIHESTAKWDYNWDRLEPSNLIKPAKNKDDPKEQKRMNEEKEKLKPTAVRHLILIRHGEYENAKNDKERKLTALGRKQADHVGKRLKELGFNYTKLTRSTMTRAMETSDIILKYFPDLPTESDNMLREGSPIPPEPASKNWHPAEEEYFKDGPRIEAAFRKYFHRADPSQTSDSYEIIVCHGNVIRYFVCRALQFRPGAWLQFALHHCSITWITIVPSGVAVVPVIGDFGFLPIDMITK